MFEARLDPPERDPFLAGARGRTVLACWAFERDFLCAGRRGPANGLFRRLYVDPGDYELARMQMFEMLKEWKAWEERPNRREPRYRWWIPSTSLTTEELDAAIRRCSEQLSRLPSTRPRPEPPSDWDVIRDWIRRQVEVGGAHRALADVTQIGSDPDAAPVVWIHETERSPRGRLRRVRRGIPMREILTTSVPQPDPRSVA